MAHFRVGCWEFERDQLVLLDELFGPESSWMNFGERTRRERCH